MNDLLHWLVLTSRFFCIFFRVLLSMMSFLSVIMRGKIQIVAGKVWRAGSSRPDTPISHRIRENPILDSIDSVRFASYI
ncbi:hypothetical protein Taro_018643 [Colocasia esculenta]|uniref:Uncharacterized protein n=1 Tax=Colocasia esculenta TaxID=4460 RepID=A0A843UWV7_COLES|nr:hypothetical protein [Colocasia esculenta]